ncbi:MAG: sigma-70 family RNA polymerase sigma factor [Planctomycetaceae bacterium]
MEQQPQSSSSNSLLVGLLERARTGDVAARDQLFSKCRNYVEVLARAQVESWMQAKVDASDLVQQTLMEAHRGFDDFAGHSEGEWLAWLRQILTHNTQDVIRRYRRAGKRQVHREQSLDVHSTGLSGSFRIDPQDVQSETPSQLLAQKEREIELADAIAQLTPDHQEVIILRNLQRLPFDEVATIMKRTRPATQMLWMRAVKRLESLLSSPD